jgi:TusA-related sulfurtransferase
MVNCKDSRTKKEALMIIDTRGLSHPDTFRKIRDGVSKNYAPDEEIIVLIDSPEKSRIIRGYAEMSGCETILESENGCFLLKFRSSSCKCG